MAVVGPRVGSCVEVDDSLVLEREGIGRANLDALARRSELTAETLKRYAYELAVTVRGRPLLVH